jgi:dienelactone hydrolase
LTTDEERVDALTGHFRFDIAVLAERLVGATDWVARAPALMGLPVGYFGASTGAAAALVAAAARPVQVAAVVSQGGRPDLAGVALARVQAPTLLIVGGHDHSVLALNRQARALMTGPTRLETVPGAGHLFAEPGALDAVARLARRWFEEHSKPKEVPMADVPRITAEEAHRKVSAGDAELICAYADAAKCARMALDGAISLADLERQAGSLPKDRELIFYCA